MSVPLGACSVTPYGQGATAYDLLGLGHGLRSSTRSRRNRPVLAVYQRRSLGVEQRLHAAQKIFL